MAPIAALSPSAFATSVPSPRMVRDEPSGTSMPFGSVSVVPAPRTSVTSPETRSRWTFSTSASTRNTAPSQGNVSVSAVRGMAEEGSTERL